ncbi:MAG: hypothetical protein N3G21_07490 [Candidatus Hydrogenedentes bacterium]|nr:hypothetical protein [Candidatus Hydrogenedentota bacterium]
MSKYVYRGILAGLKDTPSQKELEGCPAIEFGAEDLAKWVTADHPSEEEWKFIRASKKLISDFGGESKYLRFEGDFTNVVRADLTIQKVTPTFWAPLSTMSKDVPHFPISSNDYPVVEMTYNTEVGRGVPAWSWYYNTGQFSEYLEPSSEWVTVARVWSYNGFPRKMENFVIRLYSHTRTKECLFIKNVRFRDFTEREKEFIKSRIAVLISGERPLRYSILDTFFPIGTYLKADVIKKMCSEIKVDLETYLNLLFEDIAQHYHTIVFLQDYFDFLPGDRDIVFDVANKYGIKVVISLEEEPTKLDVSNMSGFWDKYCEEIKKNASYPSLFGWVIKESPSDEDFDGYIFLKKKLEHVAPNNPVIYLTREANAFPIYASISSISGLSHWRSKNPWEFGQLVRTHYRVSRGQQLWVITHAFVSATGFPLWNSAPEVRLMLNLAISSGARGWLSYIYHNIPLWLGGDCEKSITGPFLCSTDVWQELGARLGRFFALSPLFLHSVPLTHSPDIEVEVRSRRHERSRCPQSIDVISQSWFKGKDFYIFYLVNQDTSEVTSVDVKFKTSFSEGVKIYDATQFVRTYEWVEVQPVFHREMFPGQGLILLIATPDVCRNWENVIVGRTVEFVAKQIKIDTELLKNYCEDLRDYYYEKLEDYLSKENSPQKLEILSKLKDDIFNSLYACEDLVKSRGKLYESESLLCACDEELSKLLGQEKSKTIEPYKKELLRLAKEVVKYKLLIKNGEGKKILNDINKVCIDLHKLLYELRHK